MGEGYFPRWLSRPCFAFVFTVILLVFLIIAIAAPWYEIVAQNAPDDNGKGDDTYVYYWQGLQITQQPDCCPVVSNTYNWSSIPYSNPQNVYETSMGLLILALVTTLVLACGIFFCMMLVSIRKMGYYMTCKVGVKWVAMVICFVDLFFILLAWTLFFRFNQALAHADSPEFSLCPDPSYIGAPKGAKVYWCDTFTGSQIAIGSYSTRYSWGPSVGWVFAVLSTALIFLAGFFLCISKKNPDDEYEELDGEDDSRHHKRHQHHKQKRYDGRRPERDRIMEKLKADTNKKREAEEAQV